MRVGYELRPSLARKKETQEGERERYQRLSLSRVSARILLTERVDFDEGGKPEYPEKNPRSQIEID